MGQYWQWLNLDKMETVGTHELGVGLKYMEQWFSGSMYSALMLLMTDMSSLGHGGGDPRLHRVIPALRNLISVMSGRWVGDRVVFSGDYSTTDMHKLHDDDGEERFKCITSEVAAAVWALTMADTAADADPQEFMETLTTRLDQKVSRPLGRESEWTQGVVSKSAALAHR
jgi:hypothetical protein